MTIYHWIGVVWLIGFFTMEDRQAFWAITFVGLWGVAAIYIVTASLSL